jgi:hypothetical protein
MDAGFSFTQANVQTQWTFNSTTTHRTREWLTELDVDSALTTSEDADDLIRNSLTIQTQHIVRPRWSMIGFAHFQQNEELSLDLRAALGGGLQRVMAQSNRTLLAAVGGAAFTREQYQGTDDEIVAEAVAGLVWDWFTFDGRSTNLDVGAVSFYALNRDARVRLELNANALAFYGLNGDNRVRLELNNTFKSDIVGDLYWSINLFDSYNSDPPTDQKTNDFGVSAAVGWSF